MYEYIDQVLGSYFSSTTEEPEEEAIIALQHHLVENQEFAYALRIELSSAFGSSTYSWRDALATHNVIFAVSEEQARAYARRILWEPAFSVPTT